MTEEQRITFRREGEPAFPSTEAEKETSVPAEGEHTETVTDPSQVGDDKNKPVEKHIPFSQDPDIQDYIGRQVEKRVGEVEKKNLETIEAIRKEFGGQRQDNADQAKIPKWFGGDQAQWDDYRADLDARLNAAEERAITRVTENSTKKSEAETKAVEEATEYMKSELSAIGADKDLNPTGKPLDQKQAEALLQIVLKNELVDTKGRWNYRAGMRILNAQKPVTAPVVDKNKDKKALAGATVENSGNSGADKPKNYKTAADFKKKRPW